MHFRYDQNVLILWLFLLFQIIVLFCYLKFSSSWSNTLNENSENLPQPVKFLQTNNKNNIYKNKDDLGSEEEYQSYYSADVENEIFLKTENVKDYFLTVNNTICFKFGTDIKYMRRNLELLKESGKCECLSGYHGNDCSLPEVIWRAFIALRQETVIHKRNYKARRTIHMFSITHPAQIPLAAIKINELFSVVDIFIVVETNKTKYGEPKPFYFKEKLDKGFLREQQYKIIHSPVFSGDKDLASPNEKSWKKAKKIIKNLRNDDLFIQLDNSVVPNPKALLFFKLFDGFSLPLEFRLKWNVYGYFYQHPNKTKIVKTGSTIRMLEEVFKNNPDMIKNAKGLVVGDLNHYGGWYCDLCYDPEQILQIIQTFSEFKETLSKNLKVIDREYLEGLMRDGLYINGKTNLIINREDRDHYYAPQHVTKNYWKYDSLMINFYGNFDY